MKSIKTITSQQVDYLKTLEKEDLIKMIIKYDKIIEKLIGNLDNYLYTDIDTYIDKQEMSGDNK
jgi:hypothetical protein